MSDVRVVELGSGDAAVVIGAAELFDHPPTDAWTARFLADPGHHLVVALAQDRAVGFVSGVETTHPDKGTEMLLYELSVAEDQRRGGIGTALVRALAEIAVDRGCSGMWVATEPGNDAAIATYRAAGAQQPEPCVTLTWTFPDLGLSGG
jgi:ribosomal protein S18 acetylase RimI-like enzyme